MSVIPLPISRSIKEVTRFEWHEVANVAHYWLDVNAMTQPMQLRENAPEYKIHRRDAENAEA